ncbi:MAG: alcohol dehydrogenase [Verrucomicrobia bacterium]|nr:MAG: alcohol dehydrogenase [Verrucomicrobiota bacterium]
MIVPPAAFGHELSGVIYEVRPRLEVQRPSSFAKDSEDKQSKVQSPKSEEGRGARVEGEKGETQQGWKIGDRVVVANSAPCGECFHCRVGQENLCENLLFLNGAYAETIAVPARLVQKNMLRLKPQTSFQDAALVEPLACVVKGIEDVQLRPGQQVLVIGAGPIGLMFVALAKQLGGDVTIAGRRAARLAVARKLGASRVIDVGPNTDLVANVRQAIQQSRDRSPGRSAAEAGEGTSTVGFDVVIEAVGKAETWEASVRLVRKGGTVNFFGGCPANTTIKLNASLLHYSNLKLLASFHHTPRTIRLALEFIESGIVRADDFVSGEAPLSDLPALFQSMTTGNQAVKTLIRVRE